MPITASVLVLVLLAGSAASRWFASTNPRRSVALARWSVGSGAVGSVVAAVAADDRLGTTVAAFALGMGVVVLAFADRALATQPEGVRFFPPALAVLAATVALATATHLVAFVAAWVGVGRATVRLIGCDGRRASVEAARRASRALRVGDGAVVAAAIVAWVVAGGSGRLDRVVPAVVDVGGGVLATLVGSGLVVGVVARSAQFPLAGWLPASVAAPTVVSALLHAGVVGGSALLLLRWHPVIGAAPVLTVALVALGTLGMIGGIAAARTRPDVKSGLAWTTVAQMGFMVVQCTLGLVGPAVIHLMAHGMFKSSLFLGASSALDHAGGSRHPRARPAGPAMALASVTIGALALGLALVVARPTFLGHPAVVLPVGFAWATTSVAVAHWLARRPRLDVATAVRAAVGAVALTVPAVAVSALVEHWLGAPEPSRHPWLVGALSVLVLVAALAAWGLGSLLPRRRIALADAAWLWAASNADPVPAAPRPTLSEPTRR